MSSPLRCLADLPDQPPQWLWPGRIPRGALTLLVGDPGRGKSLLTLDMAARVSAGLPWPEGGEPAEPGDVLLLSADDSPARTVRSRLAALGANLRRVHFLNAGLWSGGAEPEPKTEAQSIYAATTFGCVPSQAFLALWRDALNLKSSLESLPECRLVVIDPVSLYLHDVDSRDVEAARVQLAPLATLADVSGAAIVAVTHRDATLSGRVHPRQFPMRALAAMARAIHLVDRDPNDPEKGVFLPVRSNLAEQRPAIAFQVVSDGTGAPVVRWGDALDVASEDWLEPQPRRRASPALDRAVAWLQGALAGGPVASHELAQMAAAAGINDASFRRARTRLGVQSLRQKDEVGGQWFSTLPFDPQGGALQDAHQNNVRDMRTSRDVDELLKLARAELNAAQPPSTPMPQRAAG